jgi:hypothetical protein
MEKNMSRRIWSKKWFLLWMRKVTKEGTRQLVAEIERIESRITFHLPVKRWLMVIQTWC